jgi:PmbA protein
MTDDLLTLAEDVVSRARKLGADSGDAFAVDAQGTDIEMRQGEIEKLERTESRGVGLRVFVGHSSALISGSVFTPESLNRLAETAVAMARAAPPDPLAGVASPDLLARNLPQLDLVSAYLPESDELKALALAVEGAAERVRHRRGRHGDGARL